MAGTGAIDTINKDKDTEKQINGECGKFIGIVLLVIMFLGSIVGGVYLTEKTGTPFYLNDELIDQVNKLDKRIKVEVSVMEKGGFSDSKNYSELKELQNELSLVRDKLIEIRIRMKNKAWAN